MTGQGLWPATFASLCGLLSSAWAVKGSIALQGLLAKHLRTISNYQLTRREVCAQFCHKKKGACVGNSEAWRMLVGQDRKYILMTQKSVQTTGAFSHRATEFV